jgi:hypothetical protein
MKLTLAMIGTAAIIGVAYASFGAGLMVGRGRWSF